MTANIAIADSLKALDFNRPNREEPLILVKADRRLAIDFENLTRNALARER